MARKTQTLSVRISESDVLEKFVEYINSQSGLTQAMVVENLIRYFNRQSSEQKQLLAMGVGTDYLSLLGEALQLVTWGDHAFRGYEQASRSSWLSRGSFLPWIIETYNRLDEISASAEELSSASETESAEDSPSAAKGPKALSGILFLRRIAWYKLGTAWIFVARELRTQALVDFAEHSDRVPPADAGETGESNSNDWKILYNAAIDSLQVAIANFSLFNKSLEQVGKKPHPTVLYNQACTWSLIAQYISERNGQLEPQAQAALDEEKKRRKEANLIKFETCLPSSDDSEAEDALQKANEYLQEITIVYQEDPEGMPFGDAQWLFDYAEHDPDIACFRNRQKPDFNMWLKKRTTGLSLLDSYRRFRSKLPKDITKIVDSKNPNTDLAQSSPKLQKVTE